MLPKSGSFQPGIEAVKQGRYSEAIALLEAFCQSCQSPQSQEYLQAQMGLANAYHRTKQSDRAIALCQQLAISNNPQVKVWAQQALKSLTAANQPLETESNQNTQVVAELFQTANQAIKEKNYFEAIPALEAFCQATDPTHKDYDQAQIWLVKAYKANGQLKAAITLCQQLTTNKQQLVQIWAQQFLPSLTAAILQAPPARLETSIDAGSTPETVTIKLKTLHELKTYYFRHLVRELKPFEAKRKSTVISVLIAGTILLSAIAIVYRLTSTAGFLYFKGLPLLFLLLTIVGSMLIWVTIYSSATENYSQGFKGKVIEKIINFIDNNQILNYSHYEDETLTLNSFICSRLFENQGVPNRLKQNDCVSGKIGGTNIFFAEICAESQSFHSINYSNRNMNINTLIFIFLRKTIKGIPYILGRTLQGRRLNLADFTEEVLAENVSRSTIFKGMFLVANFNKTFQSKTFVVPDIAERLLGGLGTALQSLNKSRGQLVKLEDPEFEKLFAVYSEDQVEARYILSTSLMTRLAKFRKKAGREIYVSFIQDKIYIAIKSPQDLFEPKLFQTMLSFNPVREYFENLQLMMGVVEELKLNRRIWGGK